MTLLNFRDVADTVPTIGRGRLLRSGRPVGLTDAEADRLAAELRTIVDLRGEVERSAGEWAGVTDRGVRLVRLGGTDNPAAATLLPPGMTLGDLYVLLLDHRGEWFARVVAEVAAGLPALVHCSLGKDRTGMSVALILDLVGADHDLIVADYALTRTSLDEVLAGNAGLIPVDAPAMLTEAPEAAIRTFLAAVADRGGVERFLTGHGLAPEAVAALRAAL